MALQQPDLRVADRPDEWVLLAVVGRRTVNVLRALGVYGESGDPRETPPRCARAIAGVRALWLLESDHRAMALVDGGQRLVESLTPRELEVLRLLAHGHTNLAIANTLVVREGTVKYHVKNILRKLGARTTSARRDGQAGGLLGLPAGDEHDGEPAGSASSSRAFPAWSPMPPEAVIGACASTKPDSSVCARTGFGPVMLRSRRAAQAVTDPISAADPQVPKVPKEQWTMPPLALLSRPRGSLGRKGAMLALRGYLLVSVALLAVKAIHLADG